MAIIFEQSIILQDKILMNLFAGTHISLDYLKNGIPFRPEWNDHSIPSEMRASIPTGMEWLHSIPE
jgi:hypothetical protein